jgi:predicted outer membrane repeat protein
MVNTARTSGSAAGGGIFPATFSDNKAVQHPTGSGGAIYLFIFVES